MFEIDFETETFLVISLDDSQFFYVHNWKSAKEMWETLEMIYGISLNIKQERMKTRGEEGNILFISAYLNLEMLEIKLEPLSLTNIYDIRIGIRNVIQSLNQEMGMFMTSRKDRRRKKL